VKRPRRSRNFNKPPFRYKFEKTLYLSRWAYTRERFADLRRNGKIRCKPEETLVDAAGVLREEILVRYLDETPKPERAAYAADPVFHGCYGPADERQRRRFWRGGRRTTGVDRKQETELFAAIALWPGFLRDWPAPNDIIEFRLFTEMVRRFVQAGDRLLESHMWLVRSIASKRWGADEFNDLVQEGVLGLYKALENFDIKAGVRFRTFAWAPIHQTIADYLRRQRRIIGRKSSIWDVGNELRLGLYASKSASVREDYKIISDAWEKNS
jgi:hypothetical protein